MMSFLKSEILCTIVFGGSGDGTDKTDCNVACNRLSVGPGLLQVYIARDC